jgi:hypothetical protein
VKPCHACHTGLGWTTTAGISTRPQKTCSRSRSSKEDDKKRRRRRSPAKLTAPPFAIHVLRMKHALVAAHITHAHIDRLRFMLLFLSTFVVIACVWRPLVINRLCGKPHSSSFSPRAFTTQYLSGGAGPQNLMSHAQPDERPSRLTRRRTKTEAVPSEDLRFLAGARRASTRGITGLIATWRECDHAAQVIVSADEGTQNVRVSPQARPTRSLQPLGTAS